MIEDQDMARNFSSAFLYPFGCWIGYLKAVNDDSIKVTIQES